MKKILIGYGEFVQSFSFKGNMCLSRIRLWNYSYKQINNRMAVCSIKETLFTGCYYKITTNRLLQCCRK